MAQQVTGYQHIHTAGPHRQVAGISHNIGDTASNRAPTVQPPGRNPLGLDQLGQGPVTTADLQYAFFVQVRHLQQGVDLSSFAILHI